MHSLKSERLISVNFQNSRENFNEELKVKSEEYVQK